MKAFKKILSLVVSIAMLINFVPLVSASTPIYIEKCTEYAKTLNKKILSNYPDSYYTQGLNNLQSRNVLLSIKADKKCIALVDTNNLINKLSDWARKKQLILEKQSLEKQLSDLNDEKRRAKEIENAIIKFFEELKVLNSTSFLLSQKAIIDQNWIILDRTKSNIINFQDELSNQDNTEELKQIIDLKWKNDKETIDNLVNFLNQFQNEAQNDIWQIKKELNQITNEVKAETINQVKSELLQQKSDYAEWLKTQNLTNEIVTNKLKAYDKLIDEQMAVYTEKINNSFQVSLEESRIYINIIESVLWKSKNSPSLQSMNQIIKKELFAANVWDTVTTQPDFKPIDTSVPEAVTEQITIHFEKIQPFIHKLQAYIASPFFELKAIPWFEKSSVKLKILDLINTWNIDELSDYISSNFESKKDEMNRAIDIYMNKQMLEISDLTRNLQDAYQNPALKNADKQALDKILQQLSAKFWPIKQAEALSKLLNSNLDGAIIEFIQKISSQLDGAYVWYLTEYFRQYPKFDITVLPNLEHQINTVLNVFTNRMNSSNITKWTKYYNLLRFLALDWYLRKDSSIISSSFDLYLWNNLFKAKIWSSLESFIQEYQKMANVIKNTENQINNNQDCSTSQDSAIDLLKKLNPNIKIGSLKACSSSSTAIKAAKIVDAKRQQRWQTSMLSLMSNDSNWINEPLKSDWSSLSMNATIVKQWLWNEVYYINKTFRFVIKAEKIDWQVIAKKLMIFNEDWQITRSVWTWWNIMFYEYDNYWRLSEETSSRVENLWSDKTANFEKPEFNKKLDNTTYYIAKQVRYTYKDNTSILDTRSEYAPSLTNWTEIATKKYDFHSLYEDMYLIDKKLVKWQLTTYAIEQIGKLMETWMYANSDYTPILFQTVSRATLSAPNYGITLWNIEFNYDTNLNLESIKWLKKDGNRYVDDDPVGFSVLDQKKSSEKYDSTSFKKQFEIKGEKFWRYSINPIMFIDWNWSIIEYQSDIEYYADSLAKTVENFLFTWTKEISKFCKYLPASVKSLGLWTVCNSDIWMYRDILAPSIINGFVKWLIYEFAWSATLISDIFDLIIFGWLWDEASARTKDAIRTFKELNEYLSLDFFNQAKEIMLQDPEYFTKLVWEVIWLFWSIYIPLPIPKNSVAQLCLLKWKLIKKLFGEYANLVETILNAKSSYDWIKQAVNDNSKKSAFLKYIKSTAWKPYELYCQSKTNTANRECVLESLYSINKTINWQNNTESLQTLFNTYEINNKSASNAQIKCFITNGNTCQDLQSNEAYEALNHFIDYVYDYVINQLLSRLELDYKPSDVTPTEQRVLDILIKPETINFSTLTH